MLAFNKCHSQRSSADDDDGIYSQIKWLESAAAAAADLVSQSPFPRFMPGKSGTRSFRRPSVRARSVGIYICYRVTRKMLTDLPSWDAPLLHSGCSSDAIFSLPSRNLALLCLFAPAVHAMPRLLPSLPPVRVWLVNMRGLNFTVMARKWTAGTPR